MAFIKIGKMVLDLASVDVIDLAHTVPEGEPVVRLQTKNRRDEVEAVAGRPVHVKHGVYDLPPDLSEKFRWFLTTFGKSMGMMDIEELYAKREEVEAAIAEARQKAAEPRVNKMPKV